MGDQCDYSDGLIVVQTLERMIGMYIVGGTNQKRELAGRAEIDVVCRTNISV